ncbi:rfaE bifunctional protein kinase chain/domain [Pedobacter sp. UYP30]|uniref:D-glycero-beta-D-manno-heptose-7-phosphate kinase n=1 Tax=Pedobacter sp. UYP30 TaxID=1756400 RepID=UPI00339B79FB
MNRLAEKLFKASANEPTPQVLVIGDLMLDHYIFGSANRLSPEAPVPIVNTSKETKIVGGAANVACNLIALKAKVYLAGVVGNDIYGAEIKTILTKNQIDTSLIIKDETRQTTVKTRVVAGNHQIVRIDREDTHPISALTEENFFSNLLPYIKLVDIVVLSDYNKGLLIPTLCLKIIEHCKELGKKVIVDPKGFDYTKYSGAFIIKPNRKELAEAAKTEKINNDAELVNVANKVLAHTNANYLIVTLSESGIAIVAENYHKIIPIVAREVFDVTGAGDTVIATLAYCIAINMTVEEAARISNYAASVVIKHIGSATTTVEEIISAIKEN